MVQKLLSPVRNMTRGGIAGLLLVLAGSGVVLFFAAARWVNTSPSQCSTCHPQVTALWQRSHGHPAGRVSCYECHAGHEQPPASLNIGAVVRDRLVPEKYLSSDQRIEERCEACHGEVRQSGTGLAFIDGKEGLKAVANWMAAGALRDRQVRVPPNALGEGGVLGGSQLLEAAVIQLRGAEWRAALDAVGSGTLAELREPLEFSGQSLRWARLSTAKVREGVLARVRSRLTVFRGYRSTVHRGLEQLGELLLVDPEAGGEPSAEAVAQAREVLEEMSRNLKAAARARTALVRELGGMEEAIFDPEVLAKALRGVPRALQTGQWSEARQAVEGAHGLTGEAGAGFDQSAIDARAQVRAEELSRVLEEKLAQLKGAFAAVLLDLPDGEATAAAGQAQVLGAAVVDGVPPADAVPSGRRSAPRLLVAAAATAVRSLEVSLTQATNLSWADFSLREGHVQALARHFEELASAFQTIERQAPEAALVRSRLEQALGALAAAEMQDRLHLVVHTDARPGGDPKQVPLPQLVEQVVEALLAKEAGLGQRRLIKVNHKVHFQLRVDPSSGRAVDLGCLDCHRNIAHDKTQLEVFRPPMVSCFVGGCHRKDRNKDNCLRCHFQQLGELASSSN